MNRIAQRPVTNFRLKAELRTLSSLHQEHVARNLESRGQRLRRRYTCADLPATNLDLDFSGLDNASPLVVDQGELARREHERNGLSLVRLQVNAVETQQRSDRDRHCRRHVLDVKLNHLIAGNFSRISHYNFHGDIFSGLHLFRNLELAIRESRVAQPVAKWKQRLALEVTIRAAGHPVVLERRELSYGFVESDWEPAARVVIAEQDIGESSASLFARIPELHDGRDAFVSPVDPKRATAGKDKDNGLAGRGHSFEQLLLDPGQIEAGSITSAKSLCCDIHFFAFKLRRDASDEDDNIGLARKSHGFSGRIVGHAPLQPNVRAAETLKVFELDVDGAPGLKDYRCSPGFATMSRPVIDHSRTVYPQSITIISGYREAVPPRDRRRQLAGPSDREVGIAKSLHRRVHPVRIYRLIYPRSQRGALEVPVGEVFSLQTW